jgi:predicted deacylase
MNTLKAQVVSRKLATSFIRSKTSQTRIPGWYRTTEGFEATQAGEGVKVTWEIHSSTRDWTKGLANRDEKISAITEFLTSQGMVVEAVHNEVTGKFDSLWVTAK